MKLNSTFRLNCKNVLLTAGKLAEYKVGVKISVDELNRMCNLDRVEIRTIFRHMHDLDILNVESIGGEFLYGDISLTEKGLLKLKSL